MSCEAFVFLRSIRRSSAGSNQRRMRTIRSASSGSRESWLRYSQFTDSLLSLSLTYLCFIPSSLDLSQLRTQLSTCTVDRIVHRSTQLFIHCLKLLLVQWRFDFKKRQMIPFESFARDLSFKKCPNYFILSMVFMIKSILPRPQS